MQHENYLKQRAVGGDKQAYGLLFDHFVDRIYRFIYIQTGDHKKAEDLTDEVLLLAWKLLPEQARGTKAKFFFYRVAITILGERNGHFSSPPDMPVLGALAQLPEVQRTIFILRFVEELTPEEIAQVIGKPITWVEENQPNLLAGSHTYFPS